MIRILPLLLVGLLLACAEEPETIEEYTKAGERAFVDADYVKAREYLLVALHSKPSDRTLLYLVGVAYQRELMHDSAVFYLKRADLLYPKDREINLELYEACLGAGEWKLARDALRLLVKTGDDESDRLPMLAELSVGIEDFVFAYYYFRQLLERDPGVPDNYIQVANAAAELGSLTVAIAVIDSAIEEFGPKDEFLANKGTYFAAKKDYATSEKIFRALLEHDSTALPYRLNLANALASQASAAKKQEAYEIYLDLQPVVGSNFRVDSMLETLERDFNLKRPTE